MADQRIQYTEELVGSNHATKIDTINRLSLVEHNNDGTHKSANIYTDLITKRPVVDVRAFGATGDGATDDTTAIQDAINYAATNGLNVYAPEGHYKFTRLYLYYDATLNPGWPQTAGYEGKIKFFGDGAVGGYNFLYSVFNRTVLESTDATGPAIKLDGTGVSSRMSNFVIEDMSIIATNTTQVLDVDIANYGFTLNRLLVGQKGSGGGILYEGGYVCTWSDVLIYGAGKTVSDTGLIVRTLTTQNGGGNLTFINVNTVSFDKGWELGHNTYGSGAIITTINCIGCQASTHKTHGVLVGSGAKNVNWWGSYIEACQDGANGGIGMIIHNRAQLTSVKGAWFSNNDIALSLGKNDADTSIAGIDRATIEDNIFGNILVTGIQVWGSLYSYGKEILRNKFYKSASAPGTTIGIDIQDAVQRGLRVEGNEMDTTLTTTISNPARIDLFTKFDTTYGLSSQKRGNFVSFTSLDATPSVASGSLFKTANAGATTITMLDDGVTGQEVLILFNDANTTVDFTGTNLKGNGGTDFTASSGDTMSAVFDGTNWYCAVSNNT
ncbi:MAG: hypothetical protein A2X93_09165 [Deltaproteobacteria bacterium GWC2_56_8]|nr:MAG: hypothetical protein A2X99_10190 [Deltaproteobacteria bacterium GWB2_55_19]OGP35441.1 MAG: hypothetical protein A2X93_09165 [Deltaproteobacteria bacterium GWC2_56_8]HAO93425.1 hypothetical protein [Deltaproteobacteria bacterium]